MTDNGNMLMSEEYQECTVKKSADVINVFLDSAIEDAKKNAWAYYKNVEFEHIGALSEENIVKLKEGVYQRFMEVFYPRK